MSKHNIHMSNINRRRLNTAGSSLPDCKYIMLEPEDYNTLATGSTLTLIPMLSISDYNRDNAVYLENGSDFPGKINFYNHSPSFLIGRNLYVSYSKNSSDSGYYKYLKINLDTMKGELIPEKNSTAGYTPVAHTSDGYILWTDIYSTSGYNFYISKNYPTEDLESVITVENITNKPDGSYKYMAINCNNGFYLITENNYGRYFYYISISGEATLKALLNSSNVEHPDYDAYMAEYDILYIPDSNIVVMRVGISTTYYHAKLVFFLGNGPGIFDPTNCLEIPVNDLTFGKMFTDGTNLMFETVSTDNVITRYTVNMSNRTYTSSTSPYPIDVYGGTFTGMQNWFKSEKMHTQFSSNPGALYLTNEEGVEYTYNIDDDYIWYKNGNSVNYISTISGGNKRIHRVD